MSKGCNGFPIQVGSGTNGRNETLRADYKKQSFVDLTSRNNEKI